MLKLKDIKKDYLSGDNTVHALKGINLEFRKSEFVSVLGQSGCGKTTLLNIIGGLDRYTSGDLIINGKSTKDFKDRDWDAYRNYSIGFVFQNYNLISHQSVLSNVELALTLDGVKKDERRKRAIKALEEVGLKDQINKKPNQLSGGQMQRVAIARALVNNPDIILADEPTGALDTETSVQVMEILKEISKNRLIIMVTHNPELAEKYSSRIIKVLDGKVIDDSNPYDSEKEKEEKVKVEGKTKKPSMSFFTALSLSLNNLMTKKGRTILTAFAGSIGIIGIALIMSLSSGVQEYINKVEEDTLSSYPITITKETIQMAEMMEAMMTEELEDIEKIDKNAEKIYSHNIMGNMFSTLTAKVQTNNLEAFKDYLENEDTTINEASNAIQYSYDLNINLYKENTDNGILQVNPSQVMSSLGYEVSGEAAQMMVMSTDVWVEMLDNEDLIKSQYDVLAGRFPEKYNEVMLIVDEYNRVSDYTLYSLGLLDMKTLQENYQTMISGGTIEKEESKEFTFDEILNLKYKLVLNTDYYEKVNNIWVNKSTDETYMKNLLANAEDISIVGIVRVNPESVVTASTGMIGYTVDLKEYVINKINESEIAKEQKSNPEVNVLTGIPFAQTTGMAILTEEEKAYIATLSPEEQVAVMSQYSSVQAITYESVLNSLGIIDLASPVTINIYPKDFESKDAITLAIEKYNDGKEEIDQIKYTDMVGTLMSSVTSIVNTISYVLIAFVAISLVVSSIMIGIITYISVLERTKEIGILRAIGASKKDISRVFNAETFIIGLTAGLLGIGVTLLLNIPINMVIKHVTGISNLSILPVKGAIVLVLISMILTVIAGFIPAKVAAKKDPVEALRTE